MKVDVDHKLLAITLNQRVWMLLEKKGRAAEEDSEMTHVAHAGLWHWSQAGGPVHRQRSEWLIGRVFLVLCMAEAALRHAKVTDDLTRQHSTELKDFDHACAHELLVRALLVSGREGQALEMWERACELGDRIEGSKDREIFRMEMAAIRFDPACDRTMN